MSIHVRERVFHPPPPSLESKPAPRATPQGEPSPFSKLMEGLGKEVTSGERTVERAIHGGGDVGPQELLALQAGVYRYSEAVDLAAKLVDRATNGLKTVVQGQ